MVYIYILLCQLFIFHKHPTSSIPFLPLNHFEGSVSLQKPFRQGTTFRQRLQLGIHQGHIHHRGSERQIFLEAVQGAKPLGGFPRAGIFSDFLAAVETEKILHGIFLGIKFKLGFCRFKCVLCSCFGSLSEKPLRRKYIIAFNSDMLMSKI